MDLKPHPITFVSIFVLLNFILFPADVLTHPNGRDGTGEEFNFSNLDSLNGTISWGDAETDNVNVNGIRFYLYTKLNSTRNEIVIGDLPTLANSGFLVNAPTKVLIHGWFGGYNHTYPRVVREAYQNSTNSGELNIIVVDWSPLADVHSYTNAAKNVKVVGRQIGNFIIFLLHQNVTTLDKLHLIGHSLGAHVAGIAGYFVKTSGYGMIGRVTGLDPAKPLFDFAKPEHRIDSMDAEFVDVIHTTGIALGILRPVGHVDFYPNGGLTQPGCGSNVHCDHARAYLYYAESIYNPKGFRACKCTFFAFKLKYEECKCSGIGSTATTAFMGDSVSTSARGKSYLKTNSNPPFARG